MNQDTQSADVVIIGSGIGGLCCGALLAHYGFQVVICESHAIPGGAAHAFSYQGFKFDSGPSLYSGLSNSPSTNPLQQVLAAIGAKLPCAHYDTWGCRLPEGSFDTQVGANQFCEVLSHLRGPTAVQEWRELQRVMKPLSEAASALPPSALRYDWAALITAGSYLAGMLPYIFNISKLTGPFSKVMDSVVQDPFIRNWMNLLCFLLSGLPANGTSAAEMAFMFADWYRPGVQLDYPIGGSGALVDALVKGVTTKGGQIRFNTTVQSIQVQRSRATGVYLQNGQLLQARLAVVSNCSIWDTLPLIPAEAIPQDYRLQSQATPACDSFMHLHLGFTADNLPNLACHYIVVNHWDLMAPQNVVIVSIPSVLDPSLAPSGNHVLHAYTPATEPYSIWAGLDRKSKRYHHLKQERSEPLWQALERIIPDIRSRCEVTLVGTPLTHERFLRRYQGSYGPAIQASQSLFPGSLTPLKGLFCCGDSTFPGIGLPAVAASGWMTANTIASVDQHLHLLQHMIKAH